MISYYMYKIMAVTPCINACLILDADQKTAAFEVFVALYNLDNSLVERLGTLTYCQWKLYIQGTTKVLSDSLGLVE